MIITSIEKNPVPSVFNRGNGLSKEIFSFLGAKEARTLLATSLSFRNRTLQEIDDGVNDFYRSWRNRISTSLPLRRKEDFSGVEPDKRPTYYEGASLRLIEQVFTLEKNVTAELKNMPVDKLNRFKETPKIIPLVYPMTSSLPVGARIQLGMDFVLSMEDKTSFEFKEILDEGIRAFAKESRLDEENLRELKKLLPYSKPSIFYKDLPDQRVFDLLIEREQFSYAADWLKESRVAHLESNRNALFKGFGKRNNVESGAELARLGVNENSLVLFFGEISLDHAEKAFVLFFENEGGSDFKEDVRLWISSRVFLKQGDPIKAMEAADHIKSNEIAFAAFKGIGEVITDTMDFEEILRSIRSVNRIDARVQLTLRLFSGYSLDEIKNRFDPESETMFLMELANLYIRRKTKITDCTFLFFKDRLDLLDMLQFLKEAIIDDIIRWHIDSRDMKNALQVTNLLPEGSSKRGMLEHIEFFFPGKDVEMLNCLINITDLDLLSGFSGENIKSGHISQIEEYLERCDRAVQIFGYVLFCRILFETGQIQEAEHLLEKSFVLKACIERDADHRIKIPMIKAYLAAEKFEKVEEILKTLKPKSECSQKIFEVYGLALEKLFQREVTQFGFTEDKLIAFKKAIDPERFDFRESKQALLFDTALFLAKQGHVSQSLEIVECLDRLKQDQAWQEVFVEFIERKDFENALKWLAGMKRSQHFPYLKCIVQTLTKSVKAGNSSVEEIRKLLDRAIQIRAITLEHRSCIECLGSMYEESEKPDVSIETLNKAIEFAEPYVKNVVLEYFSSYIVEKNVSLAKECISRISNSERRDIMKKHIAYKLFT